MLKIRTISLGLLEFVLKGFHCTITLHHTGQLEMNSFLKEVQTLYKGILSV